MFINIRERARVGGLHLFPDQAVEGADSLISSGPAVPQKLEMTPYYSLFVDPSVVHSI